MHLTEQTNYEKGKDAEIITNVFNNFFLTVIRNLNLHQVGKENAVSFL
jgi:hypothetical protein